MCVCTVYWAASMKPSSVLRTCSIRPHRFSLALEHGLGVYGVGDERVFEWLEKAIDARDRASCTCWAAHLRRHPRRPALPRLAGQDGLA